VICEASCDHEQFKSNHCYNIGGRLNYEEILQFVWYEALFVVLVPSPTSAVVAALLKMVILWDSSEPAPWLCAT
jgi:hypothetical protein